MKTLHLCLPCCVAALLVAAPSLAAEPPLDAAAHAPPPPPTVGPPPSFLHLELGDMLLEAPMFFQGRYEGTSAYAIDDANRFEASGFGGIARVGLRFDAKRALVPLLLLAEYEHDLATGYVNRSPVPDAGAGYPIASAVTDELRKLYLRASLGWYAHVGFGINVSHWGLGLVANDGAHGFVPESPAFTMPRSGDRVVRGFLATGPHTDLKLFAALAYDSVLDDDVLLEGDTARQIVGSVIIGRNQPTWAGAYVVRRSQDAASGGTLGAWVIDVAGEAKLELDRDLTLHLGAELAYITGDTTLAATPEHPQHDVDQRGAVLRAGVDARVVGGVLDFVYASGDGSFDDGKQAGFKSDPNFPLGIPLHSHYLAAQTARAPANASNPELLGLPPRGVERLPSQGGVTNTLALFPRVFWRPVAPLEIYGGVLFAWSAEPLADPLKTRLAGGTPRNAFDEAPGGYLGTELDLGIRYRGELAGTELEAAAEWGVLQPGSAFAGGQDKVTGGRVMLQYRL